MPIVIADSWSKSGVQLPPWFSVRKSPPEANATRSVSGLVLGAAMSTIRPPWISGPTFRNRIAASGEAFSIPTRCS